MARPREFDDDTVLDALRDVFWQHGYEGASYTDIMAATGLKKGSLYSVFGDKRALYQQALARYDTEQISGTVALLNDPALSAKVRISMLFDFIIEAAETKQGRWGCLLCNAAVEQAPFNIGVETTVQTSMNRMKTAIDTAVGSDGPTELIWTAYFGGRVLVKSGAKKAVLRALKIQILSTLSHV